MSYQTGNFDILNDELENIIDIDMSEFGFEKIEKIDISDFFEEDKNEETRKEKKQIICPHCNLPIEI